MAQPSNRDQLVTGAMHCLKIKGYASTTARDIAAASGANLASIGYHFGSKDALLDEALIRILEERNRHVGTLAVVSGDSSPLDYLTSLLNAATGVFEAPRPLFVAFVEAIAQAEHSSNDLREQMVVHYRESRRGLAKALEANLGGRDPEVMSSLLLALFDGLLLQRLLDSSTTPTGEQLLAALVDLARPASTQRADSEDPGGRSRPAKARRRPKQATRRNGPPEPI